MLLSAQVSGAPYQNIATILNGPTGGKQPFLNNVAGTLGILEAAIQLGVCNIVTTPPHDGRNLRTGKTN